MATKTQTLPEKIAERLLDQVPVLFRKQRKERVAALIREELLGSELFKAAEKVNHANGCGDEVFRKRKEPLGVWVDIPCTCGVERLRAALNELRNEGKNG